MATVPVEGTRSARTDGSAQKDGSAGTDGPARAGTTGSARAAGSARTSSRPSWSTRAGRRSGRSAPAGDRGGLPRARPAVVRRRTARALLGGAVAVLVAVAHQTRPAPYGDRLVPHARVEERAPGAPASGVPLRTARGAVEAYDTATGRTRWTYAREGRRPLALLPARGHAIALWDDGLVTDITRHDGSAVHWHRALPGTARWLTEHGAGGVLRLLDGGVLAVITPERVAAYRVADGGLRWILPTRPGCRFVPARAVRHGGVLLIARPCPAEDRWTAGLVAVDGLGVVTPHRAPPREGARGERHSAEHPRPGKVVAPPR
ncbi:PQQ-binding-like beta-propeller repeat protein [Streptomyces sp. NPDC005732]|uniref:outer membrane protein assembly factor BamB family protein n=1 Tax=Streptomyces sp. NPDC005732 TaxID=3157057 RepID=UPI0033F82D1B